MQPECLPLASLRVKKVFSNASVRNRDLHYVPDPYFGRVWSNFDLAFFSLKVVPVVAVTNEHVLGLDIKRVEEHVPTAFQLGLLPVDNSPVFLVCYVSC